MNNRREKDWTPRYKLGLHVLYPHLRYFCGGSFFAAFSLAMPRIIHCILNDLSYEQRAHKIALTLSKDYDVLLLGVVTPGKRSPLSKRSYKTKRLFVPISRGMLFFLLANLRFFFYLLFLRRWDLVLVADLDALLGAYAAAQIRGRKLVLDSRELYPGLPSLYRKPFRRWIWQKLESFLYPRVRYHWTVSPSIAAYYRQRYGLEAWLIYNFPLRRRGYGNPRLSEKLLIYRGVLHPYRGLEELILALSYAREWRLWIAGDGVHRSYLEAITRQHGLEGRVLFLGLIPPSELDRYTMEATMGVSGEIPITPNHAYALPNKLFDYIQLGLPVLGGEAPLIRAVIRGLGVGYVVERWRPKEIANALSQIESMPSEFNKWVGRAREAARQLNWERQMPCIRASIQAALFNEPSLPQHAVEACKSVVSLDGLWLSPLRPSHPG